MARGKHRRRASILLLAYNQRVYTEICLRSLFGTVPADVEILVLNNGSSDDTGRVLRRMRDPRLRIVTLKKNVGVARGFNTLRRHMSAGSPRMVFLNNDIVLQDGWFDAMDREMTDHPDVGVVGAKLLYPQTGCVQHAGALFRPVEAGKTFEMFHVSMNNPADSPEVLKPRDFPAVTGALMMTSTDLFDRAGGWDDRYWLSCEDTDFCLKVLDRGKRVRYLPAATAWHFGSVTVAGHMSAEDRNLALLNRRWAKKVFRKWKHFIADPFDPLRAHLKQGRKRALIFGTGSRAERFLPMIHKLGFNLVGFSDNNPGRHNGVFHGKPVVTPDEVPALKPDLVIIASMHRVDILRQLTTRWENRIPVSAV